MKTKLIRFGLAFLMAATLWSCQWGRAGVTSEKGVPVIKRDLEEIRSEGKLRALVAYSATGYFLYKGQPMGYEYELLKRLAEHLNLELEVRVVQDLDQMLEILQNGQVDLVAHGLAITRERKEEVAFTDYLYLTKQVLVQRKPANWRSMTLDQIRATLVDDPVDLIGDTVSVRKNSSYLNRLENLSREIGGTIVIDTLEGNLSTDEIIKMVVDKRIKYTVADWNLAHINASSYPILDVSVPVSFSQRIGWAVRKNARGLQTALDAWIAQEKKSDEFYYIYNKYFENRRSFNRRIRSEFYSLAEGRISPYDSLIQTQAAALGWDWRLLASQVYQESRFDANATAWTGARGLMQLMPSTAQELGVSDPSQPEQSLKGGVRYLQQLRGAFEGIPDSLQQIKFTLAAYNCGLGHVQDARRLAATRGLDPDRWDRNVDQMILALSYPKNYYNQVVEYGYLRGVEPYRYVKQIFERYAHYESLIPRSPNSLGSN
ncbi:MAG: transporter substrate-binding domain-containing protein [Robiginitalea sp.]|nr:transporter substrate-binding domain-containing protein [Robiginitalea sp.]